MQIIYSLEHPFILLIHFQKQKYVIHLEVKHNKYLEKICFTTLAQALLNSETAI